MVRSKAKAFDTQSRYDLMDKEVRISASLLNGVCIAILKENSACSFSTCFCMLYVKVFDKIFLFLKKYSPTTFNTHDCVDEGAVISVI